MTVPLTKSLCKVVYIISNNSNNNKYINSNNNYYINNSNNGTNDNSNRYTSC